MNTGTMFSLMDVIVVACGGYILYAYYLLAFKNQIKKGVLVSAQTDPKKCKDFEGYKKYMSTRTLLFGLTAVISGLIGLYQDFVAPINSYVYLAFFILFFVVLVWFVMCVKKAEKMFF